MKRVTGKIGLLQSKTLLVAQAFLLASLLKLVVLFSSVCVLLTSVLSECSIAISETDSSSNDITTLKWIMRVGFSRSFDNNRYCTIIAYSDKALISYYANYLDIDEDNYRFGYPWYCSKNDFTVTGKIVLKGGYGYHAGDLDAEELNLLSRCQVRLTEDGFNYYQLTVTDKQGKQYAVKYHGDPPNGADYSEKCNDYKINVLLDNIDYTFNLLNMNIIKQPDEQSVSLLEMVNGVGGDLHICISANLNSSELLICMFYYNAAGKPEYLVYNASDMSYNRYTVKYKKQGKRDEWCQYHSYGSADALTKSINPFSNVYDPDIIPVPVIFWEDSFFYYAAATGQESIPELLALKKNFIFKQYFGSKE